MKRPTEHRIKQILFWMLMAIMLLPMIHHLANGKKVRPLKGAFQQTVKMDFKIDAWMDGSFQDNRTNYFNENFGFRSMAVRLYNQMNFVLFKKSGAQEVVIGKENYLYEENYIKAYLGINYLGRNTIVDKVEKLKVISDSLGKKGVKVITILAPGKGSFYPEYIPDYYRRASDTTLYDVWKAEIQKNNLLLLDLHQWFRNLKSKSPYPLFPKTGVHWSAYGEILAADTMVKFMETVANQNFVNILIDSIQLSTTTQHTDQDAEESLNLLTDIPDLEMAYPQYHFSNSKEEIRPNVIFISDSYYWGIYGRGIAANLFNNNAFWYYFHEVYNPAGGPFKIEPKDLIQALESADFVVLMSTDANLEKFAFGFIETTYRQITNPNFLNEQSEKREMMIQEFIFYIKSSPDWLKAVEQKAKDRNISLEEAIRLDAEYMADQELKKQEASTN